MSKRTAAEALADLAGTPLKLTTVDMNKKRMAKVDALHKIVAATEAQLLTCSKAFALFMPTLKSEVDGWVARARLFDAFILGKKTELCRLIQYEEASR